MTEEHRNMLMAFGLSMLVLIGWYYFVDQPRMASEQARLASDAQQIQSTIPRPQAAAPADANTAPPLPGTSEAPAPIEMTREMALAQTPRIRIETGRLHGSISLLGGRLDDLTLAGYRETVDKTSPEIILLSPAGTSKPYYAEYGFVAPAGVPTRLPDAQTLWRGDASQVLQPGSPVSLSWDNGAGLEFTRTIAVDEDYLFTITQKVKNTGNSAVSLLPYGLVSRHYTPEVAGYYILHEGLLGVLGGTLSELTYEDIRDSVTSKTESTGGWLGITDKYWLVSLIPDQATVFTANFSYAPFAGRDRYQADYLQAPVSVAPKATVEIVSRLFAGAKKVDIIDGYADSFKITLFDRSIDWGMFYFLTKPLFALIHWFYELSGNFGIAIILLTLVVKLVFFPLANKSYVAMSRMKKLQPLLVEIREKYPEDKMLQQKEMMDLYKREKANPLAGCLPVLIQIPVFFALYKVLFVTIEMRHAPFFGWIHDLAAPDPTSMFNLFGLIPWSPPQYLMIGLWPIVMGISMWMQQRLNPAPTDPVQEKVFMWMPVFFTFLLGTFPAGLVIYWTVNNALSILQQMVIMKREGAEISFRI